MAKKRKGAPTRPSEGEPDKQVLEDIADALTSETTVVAALDAGLAAICARLDWSYAAFSEWDGTEGRLRFRRSTGAPPDERSEASELDSAGSDGLTGRALKEEATIVRDDAAATLVWDEGQVVGIIELTSGEPEAMSVPPAAQTATLSALGRMMGRLLSRVAESYEAKRLSAIVECSAAAMVFMGSDQRIEYLNPAAHALLDGLGTALGLEEGGLLGEDVDTLAGEHGFFAPYLERGLPQVATARLRDVSLSFDLQAIRADGREIGTLITVKDVTTELELAEKQAEILEKEAQVAALQRRRQAEQAARAEEIRRQAEEARERAEAELQRSEQLRRSISEILEAVQAAARGDLSVQVPVDGVEQLGQLGEGIQQLLNGLRGSLVRIREEAHEVTSASQDVATVAHALSTNANDADRACADAATQAQRVDDCISEVLGAAGEVDASLALLGSRVARSEQATALAVESVDRGVQRVGELVQSGQAIGNMVGAIGRIAAQTRLLALNASIEAARAGSSGRGFGVVANEVKSLAREVESAARNITEQIEAIRSQSDDMDTVFTQVRSVIAQLAETHGEVSSRTSAQVDLNRHIQDSLVEAAAAAARVTDSFDSLRTQTSSATEVARRMEVRSSALGRVALGMNSVVHEFRFKVPETRKKAS